MAAKMVPIIIPNFVPFDLKMFLSDAQYFTTFFATALQKVTSEAKIKNVQFLKPVQRPLY